LVALTVTFAASARALDHELGDAPDFRVRVQAALRLGRLGGEAAKKDLEAGLQDPHPAVRAACAVALGNVGDSSSMRAIEQALKRESIADAQSTMKEAADRLRERAPEPSIEAARYVVQVGSMRNATNAKSAELDAAMQQFAKSSARGIKGAIVVDAGDATTMRRAAERQIPVLVVDGTLTRLTQTIGPDGLVVLTATVELVIRKIPQQTIRGMVSANASATDDARANAKAVAELQALAVGAAVDSAVSAVGAKLSALSR
jgi:hypothetical protein